MTTAGDHYEQYRIAVPPEFEAVFTHGYFAANRSDSTVTRTLLPSFQTILLFSFGADILLHTRQNAAVALTQCMVIGPVRRELVYSLPAGARMLAVNFKDDAFYRFFGKVLPEAQQPLHPDRLLPENCFTGLWSALSRMDDPQQQMQYLLDFCRPWLRERNAVAGQLAAFTDDWRNAVKSIAAAQGRTERHIQLVQKRQFGYSDKERSRYLRFLKAVGLIGERADAAPSVDWFEIIDACRYYDQSQLIHDFRHYLNLSPTQYLRLQQDICNPLP